MRLRRFHKLLLVAVPVLGAISVLLGWRLGIAWGVLFVLVTASPLGWMAWQRKQEVIFYPTHPLTAARMLEMARIRPGEVVYDLGCGHGLLLVEAAKRYKARAFGMDRDPVLVFYARVRALFSGVGRQVHVRRGDLHRADLSRADVVLLYLNQELNHKLQPKLLRELNSAARVVSNHHEMEGWEPEEVQQSARPGELIYLYRIGRWQGRN